MSAPLKIGMAWALALSALPAFAQAQPPYQPQPLPQQYQQPPQYPQYQEVPPSDAAQAQYQRDHRAYETGKEGYDARKDAYDTKRQAYEASRADYQAARTDYDRRHADWERARSDYDARHGHGAYSRIYGLAPSWDDHRWGAYDRAAPSYGRDAAYVDDAGCRRDNSATVAGGIMGALAGAALGSNIAAHGHRNDGAVLGGVVGAFTGTAVGNAHTNYVCDQRGPYYSYRDTFTYREARGSRSGRYSANAYSEMRCRLAIAPIDNDERDFRYVRVCPDADGRYRITG